MKIKQFIEKCVAENVFPGAAWIIGNSEKVFEKGNVGVLGQGLGPVTDDSLYDIASVTKLFTASAFMKQFEEGLARLEDPVEYFLPSFHGSSAGEILIYNLLTHTSILKTIGKLYEKGRNRAGMLEEIKAITPRSDSPEKVLYTCEAFILLGEIISAIDSAPLDKIVRQRVFEPLRMKDTCYNPPASVIDRIAATENCLWRGKIVRGQVHDENAAVLDGVSGNAGIFSNIIDMSRFAVAMLGSFESGIFLKKPIMELITRNHTEGKGENRGLAWMKPTPSMSAGDLLSKNSFGHTGFTGTSLWIDPDRKFYIVLLSNRVHPTRDNPKIFRARQILHNLAVLEYA